VIIDALGLKITERSMARQRSIGLKRAYEEPSRSDGFRLLVDRLWPRGLTKEAAKLNGWLRDLAPSDSLRK
jgi:uncharacterized protein YeaO (DUF488 family)